LGSCATANKGKVQTLPYRKYTEFPLQRKKWLVLLGNSSLLTHRFTRNIKYEVSRSHSDTPHPIGLLWTSDQPVAKISTRKHTTSQERGIHAPAGIRTRNPKKRAAADPRRRQRSTGSADKYTKCAKRGCLWVRVDEGGTKSNNLASKG
jgi:hypothetical protein